MNLIAERIIAYLRSDATLITLLAGSHNIFVAGVPQRPARYITVSSDVGDDGNAIPTQKGSFFVECITSRKEVNAHKTCIELAKRVNDLINKNEILVSNATFDFLNLTRAASSGLQEDSDAGEFYFQLEFDYILSE